MPAHWTSLFHFILISLAGALLLIAAAHDMIARTVPNWVSLLLGLTGLSLRIMDDRVILGLLCGAAVFIVAAVCWRRGWLGGGDVKLLGAAAIAIPPSLTSTFLLVMSLTGSCLAVAYLIGRGVGVPPGTPRPARFVARAWRVERWRLRRGGPLPYACAIAAGGLFVLY